MSTFGIYLASFAAALLAGAFFFYLRWVAQGGREKCPSLIPDRVDTMDDVRHLLAQGDKIGAIKMYREINHVSLKQAKDAVEAESF